METKRPQRVAKSVSMSQGTSTDVRSPEFYQECHVAMNKQLEEVNLQIDELQRKRIEEGKLPPDTKLRKIPLFPETVSENFVRFVKHVMFLRPPRIINDQMVELAYRYVPPGTFDLNEARDYYPQHDLRPGGIVLCVVQESGVDRWLLFVKRPRFNIIENGDEFWIGRSMFETPRGWGYDKLLYNLSSDLLDRLVPRFTEAFDVKKIIPLSDPFPDTSSRTGREFFLMLRLAFRSGVNSENVSDNLLAPKGERGREHALSLPRLFSLPEMIETYRNVYLDAQRQGHVEAGSPLSDEKTFVILGQYLHYVQIVEGKNLTIN